MTYECRLMLNIEINNQQSELPIDADRLTRAVETMLVDAGVEAAAITWQSSMIRRSTI